MKKYVYVCWIMLGLFLCQGSWAAGKTEQTLDEKVVPFLYGDMDQWVVREISESAIIGGETKLLYEIAPHDTIKGNIPYANKGGSPWANSNVMAKVAGIVKTNVSVFPERRGTGWCARMETRMEKVKVFGIVDIEVVAAGSVFLGCIHEPIKGTKNPQSMLLSGIPFTKRPKALQFDYKVKVMPEHKRVRSTGFSRKTTGPGFGCSSLVLAEALGRQRRECILQTGWNDGSTICSIK